MGLGGTSQHVACGRVLRGVGQTLLATGSMISCHDFPTSPKPRGPAFAANVQVASWCFETHQKFP